MNSKGHIRGFSFLITGNIIFDVLGPTSMEKRYRQIKKLGLTFMV